MPHRYLASSNQLVTISDSASQVTILALVALCAFIALLSVAQRNPRRIGVLAAAGLGSIAAYGVSEILKVVFKEPRPCHVEALSTACPPFEDWSFPSNHSVIAFALATALVITSWKLLILAMPLAVITAGTRVLSGEHYFHDVVVGALLGILIVVLAVFCLRRPLVRVADRLAADKLSPTK